MSNAYHDSWPVDFYLFLHECLLYLALCILVARGNSFERSLVQTLVILADEETP